MAVQTPLSGLLFMRRLLRISSSTHRHVSNRDIQGKLHKHRRVIRTFSTASLKCKENEGDNADSSSPRSTELTPSQALMFRKRRPLSPLERISGMLPQDTLSPEVLQLREQSRQDPEDGTSIQESVTQEDTGHEFISGPESHHASDEAEEPNISESHSNPAFDGGESCLSASLPGENLIAFGELLVAEYRRQGQVEFRKMFQLQTGTRLQSAWGVIMHNDIAGQPAGCSLKTNRGVSLFIRRASLDDYVLFMKRAPVITYPKDAVTMLMMMDVSEGDCVLESGSGSGAMSLFLSRAVGSKGRVLSVEVRDDHQKRAILNYNRWRTAWSLRRGEEWPDNVQFLSADLSTASSLLAGQGFHSVALDMSNPQLVLPTVIPHLHSGAVCAVYLANITQVTDMLEGLRCLKLPVLYESTIEVPIRDWLVAPARQKDGSYCTRKAPIQTENHMEEDEETSQDTDRETTTEEQPAFGSVPYIARPHPLQKSHTAFLVKLRKYVQ
ncbi:tRNA (adenine(58)-N(1))-methyltransferase, mitochondrial isoform X2 [Labrus mixtus]|uniref:tRNA (adenine(58)-N(1))-methyltransferase, mitochondrial isoform X2 n=1 Tax=Labrus mixtus TaxID=508554 RepID=UPI0029C02DFA|nr:tRNA (adenine(58)-N(1))-methyltransferase, mitochondrial isoform X2 [Labrus mixtus]